MPAYNAAKFIQESIDSVLNQTYTNWELIIIDDGSTDNTIEVANYNASKDVRIKVISQTNGRQGKARNNGIAHSNGELIALLDSDDIWNTNCLERQVLLMQQHQVDFVNSNVELLYMDELPNHDPNKGIKDLSGGMVFGEYSGETMLKLLSESNRIVTMTALFKRTYFEEAGKFEEALKYQNCEDYDLWLRMANVGATFYGNNEILGKYRKHSGGSVFNIAHQLIPEINVLIKNNNTGIISYKQLQNNLSWLIRVLLLSEFKKDNATFKQIIMNIEQEFLPNNLFNLWIYSKYDIIKYILKNKIKIFLK